MLWRCITAPESIFQAIAIEDAAKGQRLVICCGFAKIFQQFFPPVGAWVMLPYFV